MHNLLELTAQAYYDLDEDEQADVRENVEMVPILVKLGDFKLLRQSFSLAAITLFTFTIDLASKTQAGRLIVFATSIQSMFEYSCHSVKTHTASDP